MGFRPSVRFSTALVVALVIAPYAAGAQPTVVKGQIRAPDGTGVSYANVRVKGTTEGAPTNDTGHFHFRTRRTGRVVIRASAVGHEPTERVLRLASGDTTHVQLELSSTRVHLEETVITGDSYSTGLSEQSTLDPTEAVTTPGASGDLFRALQSFPGVTSPGDGAGLFVRGGDVSETKTVLDQATVYHPYRYESPVGGTFGAVRPFLVGGTEFSMGGFSAKYGDALSGILSMNSRDRPTRSRQYINLGMAAASLSLDQPLLENELGLRLSGNRSFTGVLFRLNGQREDYSTVPQGLDGNLNLTWDYGEAGRLALFSFTRHNRIGVEVSEGAYSGLYRSRSTNHLHNLRWVSSPGSWTVESSVSRSAFSSTKTFGALALNPADSITKLKVDADRTFNRWTLKTGGTVERQRYHLTGTVPQPPTILRETAPTQSIDSTVRALHRGGYVEVQTGFFSPLLARVGLRTDHVNRGGGAVMDPRAAVFLQIAPHSRLRAAWGIYHQFPQLPTYGKHTGDNELHAQRAEHLVFGLQHERDDLLLRAEAYRKPYRNLVVRTGSSQFANEGTGVAKGIDLFAKYGAFLQTRFNGWTSYSLLQSRRTQARDLGSDVQLAQGPAPYDLTHQFTVVGKIRVIDQLRLGGTYRYTTGRPFTPVARTQRSCSGARLPVDGAVGSERLPDYHRLDLQISYYWPFNRTQNVIFYAAINNVFDRANAVDVSYSQSFTERQYRTTKFQRSVYVGLTLTL